MFDPSKGPRLSEAWRVLGDRLDAQWRSWDELHKPSAREAKVSFKTMENLIREGVKSGKIIRMPDEGPINRARFLRNRNRIW